MTLNIEIGWQQALKLVSHSECDIVRCASVYKKKSYKIIITSSKYVV